MKVERDGYTVFYVAYSYYHDPIKKVTHDTNIVKIDNDKESLISIM